ncbi:MAG: threonine--tRNA ligase [Bacteroidetes bacterium]|nr:threonine--tRNA ligase [Bacteroidota bacterium]MDA0931615.1 threonine--tRNA ligase [Bacteroidota bacterium]
MVKITLPDGSVREYPVGTTAMNVAESISQGLARQVLAAKINGELKEAATPLNHDAAVQLLTWQDADGKSAFWHSSAHVLAEAVQALYPHALFTIGPAVEQGFYYDIDFGDSAPGADDLTRIEEKMMEFARQANTFSLYPISKADALDYYRKRNNPYKVELIENLADGEITFCDQGSFTDLCRGGHIPDTGYIKAVKLLNLAGAYWRGNEKNKQLVRIYGVSFPKQSMLKEHLELLEEAKKRDHRKLGQELGLFAFSQRVGKGLPLWLPKGAALRERLEQFMRTAQRKAGYQPVITPHIGSKALYETSGHWDKYGADSFQPIETPEEGELFMLKPMNCPHHCEIYKAEPRSYRDLPLRLAEFGTVYRYEQSGELHGLTRVRGFTQDDAHIFCRPDQVKNEFVKVIDLVLYVFKSLNFSDYRAQVSLRSKEDRSKYIGSDENWEKAESAIVEAAAERGLTTVVEYGEAAFYGPKLDFMVKDALGRSWQLGTIQVDYNLPERFELEYTGQDNQKHRPVMIHRAPFGSMERFVAVLTEHCGGNFPLWLSPEQVVVLPISDKFLDYAEKVADLLNNSDIRTLVDRRTESIGRKIRDNEMRKLPFMLIVGEKEEAEEKVSVREHGKGDLGSMNTQEFKQLIHEEISRQLNH